MSASSAAQFLVFPYFKDAAELITQFAEDWQLDYGSLTVQRILDVREEHLLQHR